MLVNVDYKKFQEKLNAYAIGKPYNRRLPARRGSKGSVSDGNALTANHEVITPRRQVALPLPCRMRAKGEKVNDEKTGNTAR